MLRFVVALVLLAGVTGAAPTRPAWRWPVPLEPAVSSNFCEYRDGRFHAGIDVRTFGREGVPCVAIADGWISRIRASSRGYGKALHLMLDDGTQFVYGHLAEFAPHLEDTLFAAQMIDTTYAVDFRVPRGRFRVQAGDTIAYSGSTGTLAPHLHLEVRDERDRPVDPFSAGLALADSVRPSVSRVVFVPLSAASRVTGRCLPWGVSPRRVGDGRYVVDDTLRIAGAIGVAAAVSDRVNAESGRLAPHALEVYADGSLRARIVLDRFSFESSGEVDRLYHAGALRGRGATIFQLWNTGQSPFDTTWVEGGVLPADSARVHRGRVSVRDAVGNRSDVEFHFVAGTFGRRGNESLRTRRDLGVELGGAFFQDGFATVPRRPLRGEFLTGDMEPLGLEARHLGRAVRPLAAYADDDTAQVWVAGLARGEDRRLEFPAHGLRVDVPAGALGSDVVVYARGVDAAGRKADGMKRMSLPVRLGPVGWVLHGALTVHLDFPRPQPDQAVYRYDDYRRSWSYLASSPDSTGFTAKTDRPGVFAVFRDDEAPRLGKPSLVRVDSWATGRARREIHVPVRDEGSGLDEAQSGVRINGLRRVFRWDFVTKKLVVPLHDDSIIGSQSVRVVAFDRAGNRSTRSATVDTGVP